MLEKCVDKESDRVTDEAVNTFLTCAGSATILTSGYTQLYKRRFRSRSRLLHTPFVANRSAEAECGSRLSFFLCGAASRWVYRGSEPTA